MSCVRLGGEIEVADNRHVVAVVTENTQIIVR